MSMLQWIADIGADAEWGKGSCAKEGTIPPTKLRRSGIADPATQIWGGGRFHSPKQDPEGGGGKVSEKFKKQSFKGPCEPKSGRKWLFGKRITPSSRRFTTPATPKWLSGWTTLRWPSKKSVPQKSTPRQSSRGRKTTFTWVTWSIVRIAAILEIE